MTGINCDIAFDLEDLFRRDARRFFRGLNTRQPVDAQTHFLSQSQVHTPVASCPSYTAQQNSGCEGQLEPMLPKLFLLLTSQGHFEVFE